MEDEACLQSTLPHFLVFGIHVGPLTVPRPGPTIPPSTSTLQDASVVWSRLASFINFERCSPL